MSGTLGQLSRRIYRNAGFTRASWRAAARFRRALVARATDTTDASAGRSALVVAPHPDDETLGCGATIARKVASGQEVRVVIASDGRHACPSSIVSPDELAQIRERECLEALEILGVPAARVRFLRLEDGRGPTWVDEVSAGVQEALTTFEPDEVLLPHELDGNLDHRAVNTGAMAALATLSAPPPVRVYPVWFWDARSWVDHDANPVRQGLQLATRPRRVLDGPIEAVRAGPHLETKRRALDAHRSQMTNYTGEPDWPAFDPAMLDLLLADEELFFP